MADTDEKYSVTRTASAKLAQARRLTKLLDRAIKIPGTNIQLGLDSIIGLIPGGGDVAGAIFSGYLILLGSQMGMPKHVLMRMVANVAIDTVGGSVPLLGDLFDVAWKANSRNLAMLEQFAGAPMSPKPIVNKGVIAAALIAVALLVIGGIWLSIALIKALAGLAT